MDLVRENGQATPSVMPTSADTGFDSHMAGIAALLREVESSPQIAVQRQVFALLDHIDALHRVGLTRLVELLSASGGAQTLDAAARDPVVATLLDLYGLLPGGVTATQRAIDEYLEENGPAAATVEVVQVADGVVRLRIGPLADAGDVTASGASLAAHQLESLAAVLREQIPGFRQIVLDAPGTRPLPSSAPAQLIPLAAVRRQGRRQAPGQRWVRITTSDELRAGELSGYVVDGERIVVICLSEERVLRAYVDRCPGSILPLSLGQLVGTELRCPWHGCRYDALTGQRVGSGAPLAAVPVEIGEDGQVRVQVESNGPGVGTRPSADT